MADLFDKMVQKTMQLLAVDSVQSAPCPDSPFGEGVAKCLHMVIDDAKQRGFKTFYGDGYYSYAEIGEGELFGILGHVDTVPYEGKWDANPLGEIKDNKIYGRGVLDDKGPMLSAMYAVFQLLEEGYKPKQRIRFIFGGNEETGWKCIERYAQKEEMPKKGFSPDGDFPVINCEKGVAQILIKMKKPSTLISIDGGVRANIVIDEATAVIEGEGKVVDSAVLKTEVKDGKTYITAYGKPAHGSTPMLGDNAVWHILKYASENFGAEYTALADKLCNYYGQGLGIAMSDEQSGVLTCNVGIIHVIDGELNVTLDIRHPNSVLRSKVEELLKEVDGVSYVQTQHFHDAHFVDKDDELVTALIGAYNKVTGTNSEPLAIGGATYARALPVGVAFGPMFPDQESTIHQKNEHVSLDDYRKMYDIYYEAIKELLFTK